MYKVVSLSDLKQASVFIASDKVVELSADKTKMQIANNDHAHKNQSYLAKCIEIADKSITSYAKAIEAIKTTYFVTDITNVYLKNGSAIKQQTFDTIMSSDAFLTKDGCKKIETDCIAYIDELKNKGISLIMAHLNSSFIAQNSVGKLAYGQKVKQSGGGSGKAINYVAGIVEGSEKPGQYDFETGEFSLANLLFDASAMSTSEGSGSSQVTFKIIDYDAWKDNYKGTQFLTDSQYYDSDFERLIKEIDPGKSVLAFNADEDSADYKVNVPKGSFDYKRNQTIPVAKLVEYFLKAQIKKCITTVCNKYVSQMASVPTMGKV